MKRYQIQFVEVAEGGLTKEDIDVMRNCLSDLGTKDAQGIRIQLVFANAVLDIIDKPE